MAIPWGTTRSFGVLHVFILLATVLGVSGNDAGSKDSKDLDILAGQIKQVLQDNPDLLKGLKKYEEWFPAQDGAGKGHGDEMCAQIQDGESAAKEIAEENGLDVQRVENSLVNIFCFKSKQTEGNRHKRSVEHFESISRDKRVSWSEVQYEKKRSKRDDVVGSHTLPKATATDEMFNDPYWPKQWYMHDKRPNLETPKVDLYVVRAWQKGYSGKGISVSIIDDGIQWNHTDLIDNYDPEASYDVNDQDDDPMPRWNDDNKHGTRCAGEVAMVANNSFCGVGIAFNAGIGGIRILDGKVTDRLEAQALAYNLDHVHIFSASWGPTDNGQTVDGPGKLAGAAIRRGITEGRGGKGTIYVWASGNGGMHEDDCDCDGYADSIYTFSVSGASKAGQFPWYGEKCPSTLTTAYSSGGMHQSRIVTTDLRGECINGFSGTSAAAPLAAGIVALGLEANGNLTWRDVQHIGVWTAEPAPLMNTSGWQENGFGLRVNRQFGFGLMNADAFVTAAENWIPVPEHKNCTTYFPTFKQHEVSGNQSAHVRFFTDACENQSSHVKYAEHIQIVVTIEHSRRGNVVIYLKSPAGPKIKVLGKRSKDESKAGFIEWPFMSLHSWGENPRGWWELEVVDSGTGNQTGSGVVKNITLVLYGTSERPAHYGKDGRKYNENYNKLTNREHDADKGKSIRGVEQIRSFSHKRTTREAGTKPRVYREFVSG